jgi:transcriptional regulator
VVARLTRRHEAKESKPWKMGDSAPDFIDGMMKAIVGLELSIIRLEGKAKLSQNRDPRDLQGAVDELRKRGRGPLAEVMERPSAS